MRFPKTGTPDSAPDRLLPRTDSAGPTRRDFLKTSALAGGGLVIAFNVPGAKRLAMAGLAPATAFEPNAFLRIGTDDTITVILAHSEMGQGIWTSLPMLIAEELECDWSTIRVEHAPAAPAYAHTAFGIQATGGSTTTWSEFERYRMAGATARVMLVAAAADRFGVSPADCTVANGVVTAGEPEGDLRRAGRSRGGPRSPGVRAAQGPQGLDASSGRRETGWTPLRRSPASAKFGMDVQFEGLLTAVVAHAPTFGGTVVSFDATDALAVPGVRQVVQVPSGVAVVADHFWAATRGRAALKVEWKDGPGAGVDTDALRDEFLELSTTPGVEVEQVGDVAGTLAGASKTVEGVFSVPYLAHAHDGAPELHRADRTGRLPRSGPARSSRPRTRDRRPGSSASRPRR